MGVRPALTFPARPLLAAHSSARSALLPTGHRAGSQPARPSCWGPTASEAPSRGAHPRTPQEHSHHLPPAHPSSGGGPPSPGFRACSGALCPAPGLEGEVHSLRGVSFVLFAYLFVGLFIFLGPHPWHVQVPRPGLHLYHITFHLLQ